VAGIIAPDDAVDDSSAGDAAAVTAGRLVVAVAGVVGDDGAIDDGSRRRNPSAMAAGPRGVSVGVFVGAPGVIREYCAVDGGQAAALDPAAARKKLLC